LASKLIYSYRRLSTSSSIQERTYRAYSGEDHESGGESGGGSGGGGISAVAMVMTAVMLAVMLAVTVVGGVALAAHIGLIEPYMIMRMAVLAVVGGAISVVAVTVVVATFVGLEFRVTATVVVATFVGLEFRVTATVVVATVVVVAEKIWNKK